jgi:DNA-binding CsgD family transcriptional regulator
LHFYQESLSVFRRHGDIYATLDGLTAIATYASKHGQAEVAARLIGTIQANRAIVGKRMTWPAIREHEAIAAVQSALSQADFEQAVASGQALSVDQAVELASGVCSVASTTSTVESARNGDAYRLSPREREVLRLLIEGNSNQQIGAALFISPRTAGTHVASILAKLQVHSRAAAVGLALSQQLV